MSDKLNDSSIISGVVDSLTGKMLYEFTVKVKHVEPVTPVAISFWNRLLGKRQEVPEQPVTERSFQIWPCVVVNQYRIAGVAVTLPVDLYENTTNLLGYVQEHLPKMVYIIAAAVQNNHLEPDQELITFFERNLDNIDILQILAASLQAANMQAFMNSIVLMSGAATILKPETSPIDGSE